MREQERVEEERQGLRLRQLAAEKDRDRLDEERARLAAELEVGALQASGLAGADGALTGEIAQLGEIDRSQPHIMTVLGPVEPGALGVTNPRATFITGQDDPAAMLREIHGGSA